MSEFSPDTNSQSEPAIEPGFIENSSVFITGSTGLLGSSLIQQLLLQQRKIKALYRREIPTRFVNENIQWIQGDVHDVIVLEEAMQGVAEVYHCAAIVSFNPARKYEMFKTNIEGTANVVNAALQAAVQKFCHVSSVAAIGKNNKVQKIDETIAWTEESDKSNYGKSKHLSELEVWRGIAEGLNAVIVNPSIILGSGNWNESSTKIFKTAYEEFPWYTEGETGFVDVGDVVRAMVELMNKNVFNQRFIINGENRKFKDVFVTIAEAFNKRPPHKKVNRLLAGIVQKFEGLKASITGEEPLLTKETAEAAQTIVRYDNSKLLNELPSFTFTPIDQSINSICKQLKSAYNLS